MTSGAELALLWLAWVIAGGSPGPASLAIAGTSMQSGRKAGLYFASGVMTGSAVLGLAAAFGMGALMLANAWMFEVVRYFGAAYLMYLAVKSLRSALNPAGGTSGFAHQGSLKQVFGKGVLLHLTNPKAILSWGAVYAIAAPQDAGLSGTLAFWVFLLTGSALVFIGYSLIFSAPAMVRAWLRLRRALEFTFAALFGAAALKIFTARLTG